MIVMRWNVSDDWSKLMFGNTDRETDSHQNYVNQHKRKVMIRLRNQFSITLTEMLMTNILKKVIMS